MEEETLRISSGSQGIFKNEWGGGGAGRMEWSAEGRDQRITASDVRLITHQNKWQVIPQLLSSVADITCHADVRWPYYPYYPQEAPGGAI